MKKCRSIPLSLEFAGKLNDFNHAGKSQTATTASALLEPDKLTAYQNSKNEVQQWGSGNFGWATGAAVHQRQESERLHQTLLAICAQALEKDKRETESVPVPRYPFGKSQSKT
jgi:mannose-1-phosphate guanylyltransferase